MKRASRSNVRPGCAQIIYDGKRLPSDGRFVYCDSLVKREESEEGDSTIFLLIRGWRMTGSAYQTMDVLPIAIASEKGRSLRRGMHKIPSDPRLADDGKRLPSDGRFPLICDTRWDNDFLTIFAVPNRNLGVIPTPA